MRPERGGAFGIMALAACACAFFLGLAGLFRDRLETGDIYPYASTLRSDPLGARALFEALDRYPGVEVNRAFAPADLRGAGIGDAVFFLGLDAGRPSGEVLFRMDSLARAGARVVGVFRGASAAPKPPDRGKAADTTRPKPVTVTRILPKEALPPWGFLIRCDSGEVPGARRVAVPVEGGPDSLPMAGTAWFDSLGPDWRVRYRQGASRAVVIERRMGAGSVALAADGYFASNEAMREDRPARPARLAALLAGNPARILFDENHLGVLRNDGVADLMIRHRLHWVLPSLLLLLGLFIWKARARTGPADSAPPAADAIPDTRAALAALLRRSLGARGVLENCVRIRGPHGKSQAVPESDPRIRAVLDKPMTGPQPLAAAYGALQSILNPRKTK